MVIWLWPAVVGLMIFGGRGTPAARASLAAPAAQNDLLRGVLTRPSGGRPQRGWRLYAPLIGELIGTERGADHPEFAAALARWQEAQGLSPHGVLDEETWSLMVETWQSRRRYDHAYPPPGELVTVPSADFYHPERPEELRQVERETYLAYKRLAAAAAADLGLGPEGSYLKIISSFRTSEYQAGLRRAAPRSGRAALAVNSPHYSGRALDLYVGGEPVEAKEANRALQVQTPAYRWLVRNAGRFGFRPYFYEPWHWEYCPD